MNAQQHYPVLLQEALDGLQVQPGGIYVDATFGRGGHARELLRRLGPEGRVLALDRDPQAVALARRDFADDARFTIEKGPFSMLGRICESRDLTGRVNGVLMDLGVSSPQLDDPVRGFSFRASGPLDMRMDPEVGVSAADWLNRASEREITTVIRDYGEERFARRIARAILRQRDQAPISTTTQLAALVARAVPTRERGKDPATRTFQAIRIHVNQELQELEAVLPQTIDILAVGGRLVVISFHSLEDRLVKRFMRKIAKGDEYPPDLPIPQAALRPRLRIIGKPVRPGEPELARNPRARSAVMRVAERIEVHGA